MFFGHSSARTRLALLTSAVAIGATMSASPYAATAGTISCNIPQPCALYQNATGPGLEGTSATKTGLLGSATFNATSATNAVAGVTGLDSSTNKNAFNSGVLGTSLYGFGVFGKSIAGTGVVGTSTSGFGVSGTTAAVTTKTSPLHAAVVGKDLSTNGGDNVGVLGITTNGGYGVEGRGGSGALGGVEGVATNGATIGVLGVSPYYGSIGVSGQGVGVIGQSNGASDGVVGISKNGYGVQGIASTTDAGNFFTYGSGIAVDAYSTSGLAVFAATTHPYDVAGYFYNLSASGDGISSYGGRTGLNASGGYTGLAGYSDNYPLVLYTGAGTGVAFVDNFGNLYVHSVSTYLAGARGANIVAYSTKSTTPNVEDVGSAQLADGSAAVTLDPTFAASIDRTVPYHVFVTPGGDTRGLFVATKTANGFVVRETQGGRGNLSFDYRIVASALGEAHKRMALVRNEAIGMPHATLRAPRPAIKSKVPPIPPTLKQLTQHN